MNFKSILLVLLMLVLAQKGIATTYYIHPKYGNDLNSGVSKKNAFKTFARFTAINFTAGDRILLASGQLYTGSLNLINQKGTRKNPIVITAIEWERNDLKLPAIIDFKSQANGILLEDCSFIELSNIKLTANGYNQEDQSLKMRCGLLLTAKKSKIIEHILIKNIIVQDVYYENPGFVRGKDEVKTANGTQKYGWGIRILNDNLENVIENVNIENCHINSVCHTGIKLTGTQKNIKKIKLLNNKIENTGGPGIQMSEVENVYVAQNTVSHSGSNNDSRKWGRGSGLWTWGSSNVLIEKNEFLYANGPGDSAGAHIDYNCDNIILQYNISAHNAGGFCEILGNNYNCMYRYNISINDGHRVKGVDGAFQEGKVFWLSGYQGNKEPKGPVNSYFYNNTIYSDASIEAKFAIDNTSNGVVIANNIFCIKGLSKAVLGDQNKRDAQNGLQVENVFFQNNLFFSETNWPQDLKIKDEKPIIGNPMYRKEGGLKTEDYSPQNRALIKNKGIEIPTLPDCNVKLLFDLKMDKDIMNNTIKGRPSMGAIQIN
ncbi:right-handed parallel beta-helix repeat-containing protein [Flavobacterium nackdongense]|uniref:Right-handed parallel beta-helix repeat-containing protein n=1 Tax=Flavobacterium nackdongense TaxID=2547394 RepID=A0A4P6YH97_9FLAO|nr:right-handed parallel beta-helix repeat-containing protein [Flavobacterium nackdongense]QBN20304.1 right-handed parallel beta-helix repeat-containing protein [Flavobacterium nackdongense]